MPTGYTSWALLVFVAKNFPSGVNFYTHLHVLLASAISMLPSPSTATPWGPPNCPGPEPCEPNDWSFSPVGLFLQNAWPSWPQRSYRRPDRVQCYVPPKQPETSSAGHINLIGMVCSLVGLLIKVRVIWLCKTLCALWCGVYHSFRWSGLHGLEPTVHCDYSWIEMLWLPCYRWLCPTSMLFSLNIIYMANSREQPMTRNKCQVYLCMLSSVLTGTVEFGIGLFQLRMHPCGGR